jgi:hypothetical protein
MFFPRERAQFKEIKKKSEEEKKQGKEKERKKEMQYNGCKIGRGGGQ